MASSFSTVITVLEHCRVSPPPGTVAGKSLPLTLFDLPCLLYPPMHSLFFYKFPNYDQNIIVPNLKHSLSITLKHFFPFAGNLILFPSPTATKHEIHYVDGDAVPLTFATCSADFDYLTEKNHLKC